MSPRAKSAFLQVCKSLGLFQLCSFLYRRRLQILCYHGFSLADENRFRPSLFIPRDVFGKRLAWLQEHGFQVHSLEEGLKRLREGTLQRKSVVITVDDGFYSFLELAVPLLMHYDYPWTLYVTTYYVLKESPIFRLAIQYGFWKSSITSLSVGDLISELQGRHPVQGPAGQKFMWQVIDYGECKLNEPQRVELAREIVQRLGVDYEFMRRRRFLSLLNAQEIKRLVALGVDVQLHTHRHQLPNQAAQIGREITDNREVLEPLSGRALRHLCYPSGIWNQEQFQPLVDLGIISATTCQPGLNTPDTPMLALRRFLDREDVSAIEFEAEMYGCKELLRGIKGKLHALRAGPANSSAVAPSR